MRVLVLGAEGQLGRALMAAPPRAGLSLVGLGRDRADIGDPESVRAAVAAVSPGVVINAAAYTAVDAAEDEPERAFLINAHGAGHVAAACRAAGARLLHVSTDYVFDGEASRPYPDSAPINPRSVYGASKAEGERLIRRTLDRHVILRTSWVFGHFGRNFVKTILGLIGSRDSLEVIDDQTGCPTDAADLAAALLELAGRSAEELPWGTYHFCGQEPVTWYRFAQAIAQSRRRRLADGARIAPTTTARWGQKARRPAYSVLDCQRTRAVLKLDVPDWRPGLERVVDQWMAGGR